MKDITKYQGVIPAFYACYDAEGHISTEGVKALTRHLIAKGVKGVYVGGSSGECIYQHVDERKAVLDAPCRSLRVVGDASSLEIFLNDGAAVLSTRYYPAAGKVAVQLCGADSTLYSLSI